MDSLSEVRDAAAADDTWDRTFKELKARLPPGEVRTFVRFLILATLLPAVLLFALLFTVMWKIGAIQPLSTLTTSQQQNPRLLLIPSGGVPQYAAYKLARIKELQPDIIYVGSSRCNQVRSAMFKPYSFYNACLTSWTLDQIREFIERAAAVAKPSVVIFELDYFMFTKEYKAAWTAKATADFAPNPLVNGLNATLSLAEEHPRELLASPDIFLKRVPESHTGFELTGPDAIRAGAGFRYDGSFLYPFGYRATGADLMKDAARQFSSGINGGPGLDPGQAEALSQLASSASKLGVKLVGIQLPIYAPVVDYLDTDPAYHSNAGVWRAFQSDETHRMLERLGITFFDMVRLPAAGEARSFVDPAHASEIGILSSLLATSSDPRFRSAFPLIEPERLRREYENATQQGRIYDVYDDRF
jgi:hypothetical protein